MGWMLKPLPSNYRTTNWPAYNAALKERGPLDVWFDAEIVLAQGGTVVDACRRLGVVEQNYCRWRKESGGMKMDQARRMKVLEKENAQLRRAVSDLALD